jgi:hypothetical protein
MRNVPKFTVLSKIKVLFFNKCFYIATSLWFVSRFLKKLILTIFTGIVPFFSFYKSGDFQRSFLCHSRNIS